MKKIWIFGDSTSVDYSDNEESGIQSWAHYFKELLNDEIICKNVAVGGTTLKWNYLSPHYQNGETNENNPAESRWSKIVSQVEAGDYFIVFTGGINDHGQIRYDAYFPDSNGDYIRDDYFTDKEVFMYVGEGYGTHRFFTARATTDEYADILYRMIEEIKAKGAIPLLVRGTGKYYCRNNDDRDVFAANHKYLAVLPDVAKKTSVCYLDVGSIFEEGFKEIGYRAMLNTNFAKNDNCHHNKNGAAHICDILAKLIKASDFPLKYHFK